MALLLSVRRAAFQIETRKQNLCRPLAAYVQRASKRLNFGLMGVTMKNVLLSAVALLAVGMAGASAADLPAQVYTKAPPPAAAFDPWDVAFGAAITNNYLFRGVSQSNREASVSAYFEPRYNVTKDLQLYVGAAANLLVLVRAVDLQPEVVTRRA
jgi:hypothetical protein